MLNLDPRWTLSILTCWTVIKSLYRINKVVSESAHIYITVFHITDNEEKICWKRTGRYFHSLAHIHSLSLITVTSLAFIDVFEELFLTQICNSFLERQNQPLGKHIAYASFVSSDSTPKDWAVYVQCVKWISDVTLFSYYLFQKRATGIMQVILVKRRSILHCRVSLCVTGKEF